MVGLSSRSPNAPALLRKAARLADRLNAPWYAVYIQTPAEDLTRIDAATQRILGKNLELAQQLGGIPMTFRGPRRRQHDRWPSRGSTASRSSSWARAASPGIAASSAARSWSRLLGRTRRGRRHGRGCRGRRVTAASNP